MMVPRKLWHFHGGLRLPGHKAPSNLAPIDTAPLPRQLVLPLHQHIGRAAEALVKIGDQVGKGQRIARAEGYISASIHASTSGTVSAIEPRAVPHPSGLSAPCIVIDTDGRDQWAPGLPNPIPDFRALSAIELRTVIREAGIVGLGGAAFPTAVKLNPPAMDSIATLIINGAECEPYITCDDRLMRERADAIVLGVAILQHIVKPHETLIAIEDNKPEAIAAMGEALARAAMPATEVVVIPTLYPTGSEKQLIKVLTGREVPVAGLPVDLGILCQNVGTAFAVHQAVIEGQPLIERVVTITGQGVAAPRNLRVRLGTPLAELIAYAGGYTDAVERLILGGPMMGFALASDQVPLIKGGNCVWVASAAELAPEHAAQPCIRCGQCVAVCPAQLLPQQLYWYARSEDFDKIQDHNLFDCIECGCCAEVCPSHLPLVHYYRHAKTEIWQLERDKRKADIARERHQFRLQRLEHEEQEKAARHAQRKAGLASPASTDPTASAQTPAVPDPKQAAIEAALERARAKKAARAEVAPTPPATPDTTPTAAD
ncbi:MAG: electron transport complex subunit RsxC [Thiotrichales bacterium]